MAETLARDIFTEVGKRLQQRRVVDFILNFESHLTNEYKSDQDPALSDGELQKRLMENWKTGKKRLDDVIEKFAQKQEQSGDNEGEDDDIQKNALIDAQLMMQHTKCNLLVRVFYTIQLQWSVLSVAFHCSLCSLLPVNVLGVHRRVFVRGKFSFVDNLTVV